jgi:MarR family transcriptional regulator for hemolysin
MGIEGPTLTRHLDQLEAEGLVRRTADPDDRRAVRVEPTEAGRELHERLLAVVIAFNRRLTSGVDGAELDALRHALAALEANVRPEPASETQPRQTS